MSSDYMKFEYVKGKEIEIQGRPRRSKLTRKQQLVAAQRAYRERQSALGNVPFQMLLPRKIRSAIHAAWRRQRAVSQTTLTRNQVVVQALADVFL